MAMRSEKLIRLDADLRPVDTSKDRLRADLQSDVDRFLAEGGEIKKIPAAVSGWAGKTFDMGFALNLGLGSRRY
jgi:hypothetical protein